MIETLTNQYDCCPLECDGMTRVLHTVLTAEGIEHTCSIGKITDLQANHSVAPHFWIDLPDGRRVDYRAQYWLGEEWYLPHGIFNPADFPDVAYTGEVVELGLLAQGVFEILTEECEDCP